MSARENVTLTRRAYGDEWSCEAGQEAEPTGCERHSNHYWCDTCQGYYGVPHDGIHSGRNKHPEGSRYEYCACRPCQEDRAKR